jgi:hypothetical protein
MKYGILGWGGTKTVMTYGYGEYRKYTGTSLEIVDVGLDHEDTHDFTLDMPTTVDIGLDMHPPQTSSNQLYYVEATGSSSVVDASIDTSKRHAQTFLTPSRITALTYISIRFAKSAAIDQDLCVSICPTVAGKPDYANPLTTVYIDQNTFSIYPTYSWMTVTIPVALSPNTLYCYECSRATGNGTYYGRRRSSAPYYADGSPWYSSNGGPNYALASFPTYDFHSRVHYSTTDVIMDHSLDIEQTRDFGLDMQAGTVDFELSVIP